MDNPIALAASPLTGGNRVGNRRVYMWLVKDPKEKGGVRFMEKHGAPPVNAQDGHRVAVLCNERAYQKYDMGLKSATDPETGEAYFYDDSGVHADPDQKALFSRMDEEVHVLPKETAEAFASRAFEAERMQSDFPDGKVPWPRVPKPGEVYKTPSSNSRLVIPQKKS